jgi:cytochrome c peroxidase
MTRPGLLALGLMGLLVSLGFPSASAHSGRSEGSKPQEIGGSLYEPPAPGTYELPPICRVSEHTLLGSDGKPAPLLDLEDRRVAVVSFIYRSCTDATGCPLALVSMQRLDARLAEKPRLSRLVRLVTVSFDPKHDTPERMNELRRLLAPKSDWRFMTAADSGQLAPVLDDFNQDVVPLVTDDGRETGVLRHVLKVFLVDSKGEVRNIYSSGFLDEDILLNDLQTVLGSTGGGKSESLPGK